MLRYTASPVTDDGTVIRAAAESSERRRGKAESTGHAPHPVGEETILLVEDNNDVRRTIARQLGELGYQVREAKDGQEALQMLDADIPTW